MTDDITQISPCKNLNEKWRVWGVSASDVAWSGLHDVTIDWLLIFFHIIFRHTRSNLKPYVVIKCLPAVPKASSFQVWIQQEIAKPLYILYEKVSSDSHINILNQFLWSGEKQYVDWFRPGYKLYPKARSGALFSPSGPEESRSRSPNQNWPIDPGTEGHCWGGRPCVDIS